MNHLSKGAIIFSFFIVLSCGDNTSQPKRVSKPQPQKTSPSYKKHSSNDCKSTVISQKDNDCFFPLPLIKDGETLTNYYEHLLDPKGITVGKGEWRCEKGSLYQPSYRYRCLTCNPGRSLEYCKNQLEILIRNDP